MKLTKQILREKYHIYNTYDFSTRIKPYIFIYYNKASSSILDESPKWVVYKLPERLAKSFTVYGRDAKATKLQEALSWASQKFSISEWEKSPFGSYHPKGTMQKLKELNTGERVQQ